MKTNFCRVCGFFTDDLPWGEDNVTPTYEICACCGVEFGNEDYTYESTLRYRRKWLAENAKFYECEYKPNSWNLQEQMNNIPKDYR